MSRLFARLFRRHTTSPARLPDPTEDEFLDFLGLVARGLQPELAADFIKLRKGDVS